MSDSEIFSFPYGAFIKLRLEFVLLCDDDLQARIMRIIEAWMIDQKKVWENKVAEAASQGWDEPEEPEYWCTLSYRQIIAQLYKFNTSRGSSKKDKPNGKEVIEGKKNTITRATLGNAVHSLIDKGYVLIRSNPNPEKEYEASQYSLNIPLIQEHLYHLPRKPMSYLGSNGRINGIPCADFLRPSEEVAFELGYEPKKDPRTKNVRPMNGNPTSHEGKPYVRDVRKTPILIDKRVIDSSLDKEIEVVEVASLTTQNADPTTTTGQSLSEENKNTESLSVVSRSNHPHKEEHPTATKSEPEEPLEKLPWGAEKALRIYEKIFNTKCVGSEQTIELSACEKIVSAYMPTEAEYQAVLNKMLKSARKRKRLFSPTDLLNKDENGKVFFGVMQREVQFDTNPPQELPQSQSAPTKSVAGMSQEEAEQLALDMLKIANGSHYDIQAQARPSKKSDGWIVQMLWDGEKMTVRERSRWEQLLADEQEMPIRKVMV